ncbi:hypothetical protein LINGRAHAP2_LOCUS22618 [Linum grandiflorum]
MSSTGGRGRSSRRRRRRPPPRPRSENSVIEAEGGGGRTQVVDDEACSSHPQQSTVAPFVFTLLSPATGLPLYSTSASQATYSRADSANNHDKGFGNGDNTTGSNFVNPPPLASQGTGQGSSVHEGPRRKLTFYNFLKSKKEEEEEEEEMKLPQKKKNMKQANK